MTMFTKKDRIGKHANADKAVVVPALDPYNAVMAFSLRVGGCSPPPFETLNFSVQHGDAPENVDRNFELLGSHLHIDAGRIATCRQVHGDDVALFDEVPRVSPQADAMITAVPNVYVGVKTADCLPILLIDRVRRVSAAVHAGWRGTVKRITRKTIQLMKDRFHCREEDIVAGLGPAIRKCCYEVDDAVLIPFSRNVPDSERFIGKTRKQGSERDTHTLDLIATNREELEREGVSPDHIHDVNLCTACTPELLFSYRRDGEVSGRHISLAGFRP